MWKELHTNALNFPDGTTINNQGAERRVYKMEIRRTNKYWWDGQEHSAKQRSVKDYERGSSSTGETTARRKDKCRFHFRGDCKQVEKCEYSHQIDGPITDEEVEVFINTQKLDKKTADFIWNQPETVKRAIVYRSEMLYVNNKLAVMKKRAQDGLPGKRKQDDLQHEWQNYQRLKTNDENTSVPSAAATNRGYEASTEEIPHDQRSEKAYAVPYKESVDK